MSQFIFSNIEKVAEYLISPNALNLEERIAALLKQKFSPREIEVGRWMAFQALLGVVLNPEAVAAKNGKWFDDPQA